MADKKTRGKAYEGEGYGDLRYRLFVAARKRIEKAIGAGYYCEAITIIESIIADRLESRLSYLKDEDFSFKNLGGLIKESRMLESNPDLLELMNDLDSWREARNKAIHELVKIESGKELSSWDQRMQEMGQTADEGYRILKLIYGRVADLNPLHIDRVF
jgi:hypothetical protein